MSNVRDRIDLAIARVDREIAGVLDAVLHHPELQALEAAWRGLAFVVEHVDFAQNVEVALWSCSKAELQADFADQVDVTRTRFFHTVYTAEFGQHGGRPYGAVLVDTAVDGSAADVALLRSLASVGAMAHAPVLVAASPRLLRLGTFAELQALTEVNAIFEHPSAVRWNALRATDDCRYLGVLLPRVLMRPPYSEKGVAATSFVYDEAIDTTEDRLWGSPIFAFAVRVADSFARFRSYAGVLGTFDDAPPVRELHPALGAGHVKPGVEVVLSRRLEQRLSELGFIPMTWDPVRSTIRFTTANSVQLPRTFGSSDGGEAATLNFLLGTRLPFLLLASRFAHYLKVLEREKLGAHRTAAEMEQDLNDWLAQYVVVMDAASPATRLKYPLRNGRVKVSDVEGSAGLYRMEVMLQPHLRYMRQAVTLSVSGRIEKK